MVGRRSLYVLAVVAFLGTGCPRKVPPNYVWVNERPAPPQVSGEYRIAVHDVIAVRVWNQDAMSVPHSRVREDGKISLPFLQDVQAASLTPRELAARLQTELEKYVVKPMVVVTLEERATVSVSVLGEVARAGTYELQPGALVLHALAAAGGLTQYAEKDAIYVLRPTPDSKQPQRIRFRYEELTGADPRTSAFELERGDIVVVE
jgi:polysaccharide export outer membrane protein